ncbi:MAG: hypothetical protein V4820_11795 [Pseudomonadota bacterium]
MKVQNLREVLWDAQKGKCWICDGNMRKRGADHPTQATIDHLWPRKVYGGIGDIGITLLAHKACNGNRGHSMPTDADIRKLVSVYRSIPKWWLDGAAREAVAQARNARAFEVRGMICEAIAEVAA